ncbi:MAG: ribbon-helix-helix protein, CopG family [Deltaproteobacteria bacterium]|nr:ribbon-helix-helix protein, CopG family [Deltaproteobacteria bacterium]
MRTTVRLSDDLLRNAKRFAAATGRSLTELIEDSLRQALASRAIENEPRRVNLTTSPGSVRSGIDINRMAELLDVMEGH